MHLLRVYYRVSLREDGGFGAEGEEGFSKRFHGETLYEKWILDVPKLLDLCLVYGETYEEEIAAIVERIFDSETRYASDFEETVQELGKLLDQQLRSVAGIESERNSELVGTSTNEEAERAAATFTRLQEACHAIENIARHFPTEQVT